MQEGAILEMRGIGKRFPGVQALKDIAEIVAPVNRDGGLGEVLFRYVLEEDV